jgi:threonylcarbamoyladenosine tRNA methylthiotransferase MtaB
VKPASVSPNSSSKPVAIAFETLGCKLNQAETEELAAEFKAAGCRLSPTCKGADLYILNTCTVTHVADRKARQSIRLARRLNPQARIIVTGCYAERAAAELSTIEGVDLVVSNQQKDRLIEVLRSAGYLNTANTAGRETLHNRTRSFIRAQDGCNNFCAYCIVPLVRGREKSWSPQQVIDQIRQRTEAGYREVVLTGTEIGRYNSDGLDICGLIKRILKETTISRLRLSSLQPEEITPELVDLWSDQRLCPHFHVSLQSGSDSVLQRMNRHYTTRTYQEKIEMLRSRVPDVAVTTDVIVGFPGETEAEFAESYDFCKKMQFSRLHIFTFSVREGTAAADMPDQISPQAKRERSHKMLKLATDSLKEFNSRFIGRTMDVLFERPSGGSYTGLTGNYIKVYAGSREDLTNRILPVKMIEPGREGLLGEIIH